MFVGCLLVTMLLAANWIWPSESKAPLQAVSAESPFEQTIRIQSARRWPDRIVFDTNQPTIVPPPAPVAAASAPAPAPVVASNSPLDARAEIKPTVPPAPPPKRQAKVRRRHSQPDNYNSRPDGWHDTWRQPDTFASATPMAPSWSFGRW
jgi:hypothetical protein